VLQKLDDLLDNAELQAESLGQLSAAGLPSEIEILEDELFDQTGRDPRFL
jgi:hypothetical protein